MKPISGHVFRVDRRRGPQWYAKCRLPDGRQVQRRIGPAWTGRGRPAAGSFTKRSAQAWLDELLAQARRGDLPGMVETGATVADAAAEWPQWAEHDRGCKPSALADYRSTSRLTRRSRPPDALRLAPRRLPSAGLVSVPHASVPTSRRRPRLPWRTSSDPRR